jgi:hypothetical protein
MELLDKTRYEFSSRQLGSPEEEAVLTNALQRLVDLVHRYGRWAHACGNEGLGW